MTGFVSCRPSIFSTVHQTYNLLVWPWWSILSIYSRSILLWLWHLSVLDASFSAFNQGEHFELLRFWCWPQPLDRGSFNFHLNCRIEPHWAQGHNIFDKNPQNAPRHTCWIKDERTSAVSLQYPPWFNRSPKTHAALDHLRPALHGCELIIYFQFSAHPVHLLSLCSHFQPFKEHLEGWCLSAVFCIVWGSRGSILACC